jgi:hypothetical protein
MSALPSTRELRARLGTANTLTMFHYCERGLALACGGWIAATPRLEDKAELARIAWERTLAADALRERVFELRYPSRFLEEGAGDGYSGVFEAAIEAPDARTFKDGLAFLVGTLAFEYSSALLDSDPLDDGPTRRVLASALADAERAVASLGPVPVPDPWTRELEESLAALRAPRGTPFALAEEPARDDAYFPSSFYWPDAIVPGYPYGEGVALQVRAAVSHLNEVWAVDTAGAILHGLAPELGWEWIRDAGRWTYDEARHMLMGKRRLEAWGLPAERIPLGGYIYEACAGQDPLYRLGMLGYFETKNIGRKRERAAAFHAMGDTTSETDMEFDWADETLHAEYGRRWLKDLLAHRGEDPESWPAVLERCEQLVAARVARATGEERARIVEAADALVAEATARAG